MSTYLAEREARDKVVLDREQVGAQGNQGVAPRDLIQLEGIEIPLVHLLTCCQERSQTAPGQHTKQELGKNLTLFLKKTWNESEAIVPRAATSELLALKEMHV